MNEQLRRDHQDQSTQIEGNVCKNEKTIYVPDDSIKLISEDSFGHKDIADAVEETILNTQPPFTIGIFGGWGTGKSSILDLLCENLKKLNIKLVWIDAWNYSSSENLKRSFLLRVTSELWPQALDELHTMLYGVLQESGSAKQKRLKSNKSVSIWLEEIGIGIIRLAAALGRALIYTTIFIIILVVFFFIRDIFSTNPQHDFNFITIFDNFNTYALVPFILAIIEAFAPLLSARPTIVTQERIDADEILARTFDKVINHALILPWKKRLVIIVDNLDRLSEDKIVEALEALKTYLGNNKCIYVVACDDQVVRDVMSVRGNPKYNQSIGKKQQTSEEYLDKFFQQTFRISAFLESDLTDFAIEQFARTQLADLLESRDVSISNIISTIIPSGIKSPRKVKRLINEFISAFSIAQKREGVGPNYLRPGTLTSNPEFMGKFSTIRSEFPELYKALVKRPSLLDEIENLLRSHLDDEAKEIMKSYNIEDKIGECLNYLRKTLIIVTKDIESHIWFSQDNLSKDLQSDQSRELRLALSNNDVSIVRQILDSAENEEELNKIITVMGRLVDLSLKGRAQQNGIKVLSEFTEIPDNEAVSENCLIAARHIHKWPVKEFSARQFLSIARRLPSSKIPDIVRFIPELLEDPEYAESALEEVLLNWDIVTDGNVEGIFESWRSETLNKSSHDEHSQDISIWMISKIKDFQDDADVINDFFADEFPIFIARFLVGDIVFDPKIDITEELIAIQLEAMGIIGSKTTDNNGSDFWNGVIILLNATKPQTQLVGVNLVEESQLSISKEDFDQLFKAFTTAILDITKAPSQIEIPEFLQAALNKIRELSSSPTILSESSASETRVMFVELGSESRNPIIVRNFYTDLEQPEDQNLSNSLQLAISDLFLSYKTTEKVADEWLNLLLTDTKLLISSVIISILQTISNLILSPKNPEVISGRKYLQRIVEHEAFYAPIQPFIELWQSDIDALIPDLLKVRLEVLLELQNKTIITIEKNANATISIFPFGGDVEKLSIFINFLEEIYDGIDELAGYNLAQLVLANKDITGGLLDRYFIIALSWLNQFNEEEILVSSDIFQKQFANSPEKYLGKFEALLGRASRKQQIMLLVTTYKQILLGDDAKTRDKITFEFLQSIDDEEIFDFVNRVWKELCKSGSFDKSLMEIAISFLSADSINHLRTQAISDAIKLTNITITEHALILLEITAHEGISEIMQVIVLFEKLYKAGDQWIKLATDHVFDCLNDLGMSARHKHRIAPAMANAWKKVTGEIKDSINREAQKLRVRGDNYWSRTYRKYW